MFATECMRRGWKVSLPVGEDCRYDLIVDTSKSLSRVQVKTCTTRTCRSYEVKVRYGTVKGGAKFKSYSWKDCDLIAIFVVPLNTWWIIPVEKLKSYTLNLSKNYHEYNSAWHLVDNVYRFSKKK